MVSPNNQFKGLGKSGSNQCVIDGNGGTSNWWNFVGVVSLHDSNGTIGVICMIRQLGDGNVSYVSPAQSEKLILQMEYLRAKSTLIKK